MRMTPIVAMIAAPAIIVSEYPLTAGDVDSEVMSYTASTVGADLTYHLGMSDEGLPAQVGDLEVADRALWVAMAEESLGGRSVESLTTTT
ncbi:MAG: hypothetical protein QF356_03395, partial [Acidimicrobiales bacterium]|nr:hypothetical protein [Acidimicrobiales bacterium]